MRYAAVAEEGTEKVSFPIAAHGEVDPRLVSTLLKAELPCFLTHQIKDDGVVPTDIEVNVGGADALASQLEQPLEAAGLAQLFRNLHNLIEACAYHGLPFMNVVMDTHYIYVADGLEELRFIYLPVSGKVKGIAVIKEFFQDLGQQVTPADEQAREMLARYIEYVGTDEPLNIMALSAFLGNLAQTSIVVEDDCEPESSSPAASTTEPASTSVVGPELEAKPEPESEPKLQQESPATPGSWLGVDSESEAGQPVADATTVLDPVALNLEPWTSGRHVREDPGTSVLNAIDLDDYMNGDCLSQEQAESTLGVGLQEREAFSEESGSAAVLQEQQRSEQAVSRKPASNVYRLTHSRTGSFADISGTGFTVGKSKYTQFQIPGTSTVSRVHAKFDCVDGVCSIQDNQSLNGTFVNGRRIRPDEPMQLSHGDSIRMSDEEFLFEVIAPGQKG